MKGLSISTCEITRVDRWEVNFRITDSAIEAIAVPLREDQGPALAALVPIPEFPVGVFEPFELTQLLQPYADVAADRVARLMPPDANLRDRPQVCVAE